MSNKRTIIGKTAPVPLGQQKAVNSLPVVFAEDQPAIPVEEQNKIQSEVALSLLGIPRAEVALGIFADVNTYDINPSEWSQFPISNEANDPGKPKETTTGLNHLSEEAGAELVAETGRTTILTSKRFFRYQPGRVSSSTMGVKMNVTENTESMLNDSAKVAQANKMKGAPSIKKWGIFDKSDGYYFEVANGGQENDFRCVRRTQALAYDEPDGVGNTESAWNAVKSDSQGGSTSNIGAGNWGVHGVDPVIFRNGLCYVAAAIHDPSLVFNPADVKAIKDGADLNDFEYDERYAVRLAYRDSLTTVEEHMAGRHYQFPFDQLIIDKSSSTYQDWDAQERSGTSKFLKPDTNYIRLDAHCKWEDIITNLSRGGGDGSGRENFVNELGLSTVGGIPRVAYSNGGDAIVSGEGRFGFDPKPSELNSPVKVWNLLVTTQSGTNVSSSEFTNIFGTTNHRASGFAYNPNGASSNKGAFNITLKEWFHLCVPAEFRKVYEWRPVRAMFSGDQLNGSNNDTRWSDVSTANVDPTRVGTNRPGDPVTLDGEILKTRSQYDVDFSKVTMWKIEFSWYGAVGALFLCYVPVANGEARWVRVHHMRASNQLDVASLGNATLPITYLVHGGLENNLENGNRLVKYGASYYIDGGDKGTVKLLSKSTDYPKPVAFGQTVATATDGTGGNAIEFAFSAANTERDQFIGAYLKSDSTRKVIWAESTQSGTRVKLYFNANTGVSGGDLFTLIVPRKQRAQMALRAKDNVVNTTGTPVRNRIQLYPLKYGVGLTDNSDTFSPSYENVVSLNFIKNPLLITNNLNNAGLTSYNGKIDVTIYTDNTNATSQAKGLELGSGTVPVEIESGENISSSDYSSLQNNALLNAGGKYFYAYARGKNTSAGSIFGTNPTVEEFPALVRVYRDITDNKLYVQNNESQSVDINIQGPFMFVNMYQYDSTGGLERFTSTIGSSSANGNHNKYENQKKWDAPEIGIWESIAALSGAKVSQDFRLAPVAGTGDNVFSIYANKGGETYDLSDYFAYNKEYISFPLTNEVDILGVYANWESTSKTIASPEGIPENKIEIVNSLTWEEQ